MICFFLSERMENKKGEEFAVNLRYKKECVNYIRNLKQALNHRWVLEKVHRVINFNQKPWLKSNIDVSRELRFGKRFFHTNEQYSFWENYGKYEKTSRYQVCNKWSKKELFSVRTKVSYNNLFLGNLFFIKMKIIRLLMSKPIYLGL